MVPLLIIVAVVGALLIERVMPREIGRESSP
jgi:hypothetical protein